MRLGAVILAGGASSRMGEDKALQLWAGERAVDVLWRLAEAAGAQARIVAGGDYGLAFVPDPPSPHGPAGGVIAGCAALRRLGCMRALILAVDAPSLEVEDLAPLIAAPAPGACYSGLSVPMVIELKALPEELDPQWPLRRLVERAGLHILTPPPGAEARLRGANTPGERRRLLDDLA